VVTFIFGSVILPTPPAARFAPSRAASSVSSCDPMRTREAHDSSRVALCPLAGDQIADELSMFFRTDCATQWHHARVETEPGDRIRHFLGRLRDQRVQLRVRPSC
jgi:hypothetical protein